MKRLLVKMIYTAIAVGSALWGGERRMVDQVRAQLTKTPHMEEASKRHEKEAAQRARVQAYMDKRHKAFSRHHTKHSRRTGNVSEDLNLCVFNPFSTHTTECKTWPGKWKYGPLTWSPCQALNGPTSQRKWRIRLATTTESDGADPKQAKERGPKG